jgi:DNA polymerase-3 subunit delta
LEKWALEQGKEKVYLKSYPSPKGKEMVPRIVELAKARNGQIQPEAASLLASLVGNDTRIASQELDKLLAYVNFNRSIEIEDVEHISAYYGHGDIFAMVDAIGTGKSKDAMGMLHRLLDEQDAISIFGMIIRQFRLLLLAREIIDARGSPADAVRELNLHPYVADKIMGQARRFSMPVLTGIYHRQKW